MADSEEQESILGTGITTRQVEAFSRKVTSTANHLIGPLSENTQNAYQTAMHDIHRELRRPQLQRSVFSLTRRSPSELMRARLSTREIQHRALTYIPDHLLADVPENDSSYSLFQGFKASVEDVEDEEDGAGMAPEDRPALLGHRRIGSRSQQLLEDVKDESGRARLTRAKRERERIDHRLEMLGVRKSMCSSEILEIDKKVTNLATMRKIVLDRLAALEDEELAVEAELLEIEERVDDLQSVADEEEAEERASQMDASLLEDDDDGVKTPQASESFMSQSIYDKIPSSSTSSPRNKRGRASRRRSAPIRHEHFEPGTSLRNIPAHNDMITAIDFDAPFGTLVSAALDDTVRVWDLNNGRCLGLLEGHRASVRCLQVEDTIVATGSIDASIRLWDLSQADIPVPTAQTAADEDEEEAEEGDDDDSGAAASRSQHQQGPPTSSMADCPIFSLEAHVAEVTALYMHKETLVSGSADKTLRQWDLVKGRCVQTLDVLWAAAQASTVGSSATLETKDGGGGWRTSSRLPDASADFVGALQCFDAALACGTADGVIRLWDLRSGQVSRSLIGHTGPITCLQFDDVHLITGSLDRSIRIWDLRTGIIHDAYALDNPITSMMFDNRRIASAAGEDVVKIYDMADGHQWDCATAGGEEDGNSKRSIVERVRIKDGFLVEGRRNGEIGVWTC